MAKVVVSGKSRSSIIGRLLPVVLWLLPIIALNLGFSFLARIEFYWHEKLQHELARRELEALNAGANIEYHLARHGGRIYKFIGDAIEAVFQETDGADSAMRAVKSAIEMHRAMSDLNIRRKEQGLFLMLQAWVWLMAPFILARLAVKRRESTTL